MPRAGIEMGSLNQPYNSLFSKVKSAVFSLEIPLLSLFHVPCVSIIMVSVWRMTGGDQQQSTWCTHRPGELQPPELN